jgi:hypothetical protein
MLKTIKMLLSLLTFFWGKIHFQTRIFPLKVKNKLREFFPKKFNQSEFDNNIGENFGFKTQ